MDVLTYSPSEAEIEKQKERRQELVTQIVSGLLASGHFTTPCMSRDDGFGPGRGQVRFFVTEDCKEKVAVIDAAESLLKEIEAKAEIRRDS
jgi:hypothetical protein